MGSSGAIGDDERFAQLYPSLRRFASATKPPEVDADDLIQEALVRALALRPLGEYVDPGAYLRRTIVNLSSNARRRLGRRRRALRRLAGTGPSEATYPSDLQDLLRLHPAERAAVYLAVVEGHQHAAIAEILGCSESAARTRVSRALRKLRIELDEEVRDV